MAYEYELETELEDELERDVESAGEFEDETEFEAEDEFEFEGASEQESEWEYEGSPGHKLYPDAMMEHLGALASEAETEEEAVEHFLPLVGLAASKLLPLAVKAIAPAAKRMLPRVVKAVTRVTPKLTRGITQLTKQLHRTPQTRKLLRAVPKIATRTVHTLARQAARRRPVTPTIAAKTLAHHARKIIRSPHLRRLALRRNYRMDRQFHRIAGRGILPPHVHMGRPTVPGAPATYTPGGAPRYGRIVAGRCVCGACGTQPVAAAPSYCRCCGQVLR